MLPSVESRRAAISAGRTAWQPGTMGAIVAAVAARHPDRPLVLTDAMTITYGDAVRRAENIARGLRHLGVRPGDRVALVLANHPEFVPLLFAIWRLGATAVPVNFLLKGRELAYVIRQSACRAVVTMESFRGLDYLAAFDQFAPGWRQGEFDGFPELKAVVVFGAAPAGTLSFAALEQRGAADQATLPPSPARPDDPATIMYTSGTTGLPKGVIQSHDNLARSAYACAHHLAFEDGRRTLFALPLYHAFGLVEGLFTVLFVGGAIIPQLTFDPATTLAGIARHKATYLMLVPTMSVALLEHPELDKYDLSSLKAVLAGAAPTPVWVWEKLKAKFGVEEVFTGYGMTELSGAMTFTTPEDDLVRVSTTVGRPMQAGIAGMPEQGGAICVYKTVDPFTGADLPAGAEGELCSHGPTSTIGYFDKPEETRALLLPGHWVRSGDLGRVRPDGYLELTGRSKELYKSGGELVAPKEVEELLTAHPAVGQAFVIGVPDDRWGEIGCAWIVPAPGKSVSAEEITGLCRERLARFKVPKHVLFIEAAELPTTPTGKVQKFRLVELAKSRLATV